ncbi:hypothetical protein [Microcoleus sp. AT3-D2]|uniref:hypothetical protein n=1 Tax=Microcoleus sp. AT3-D2 TaxID=2818612 RepID=UPI002FD797C9
MLQTKKTLRISAVKFQGADRSSGAKPSSRIEPLIKIKLLRGGVFRFPEQNKSRLSEKKPTFEIILPTKHKTARSPLLVASLSTIRVRQWD